MGEPLVDTRRHDLDWLRVIALALLLVFHCTRVFDRDTFHIKSAERSDWIAMIGDVLRLWRMPLLFVISGAAVYFALGKRTAREFLKDRLLRLLLPLVAGMLLIVPPQVYIERIGRADVARSSPINFEGTYLQFLPSMFDGVYPKGNFSWHHLWFLAYVGVFSVVALPMFLRMRGEAWRRRLERLGAWVSSGWRIFAPIPIVVAVDAALRWRFPTTHNLVSDWANLSLSLVFFLLGYFIVACPGVDEAIVRARRVAMCIALVATVIALLPFWGGWFEASWWSAYIERRVVRGVAAWCWIVALMGYARVWLSEPGAWLHRVRHLTYPFYIWHQTVIVVLAWFILGWGLGASASFVLLTVGSMAITLALCWLVTLTGPTRVLFGLPWRAR